jgi:hypothetical protein
MTLDQITDYIEENKLTLDARKAEKSKVKKLTKRFVDSKSDIELAQSVVNQESAAALKAYRSLRSKLLQQRLKQGDEFEYLI